MLLCSRCAGRFLARPPAWGLRALSRDTSEEVPTSFSSDLEENKTTINILNEDKSMVFFGRFGRYGFKLSTGIFVLGPVLAFPKSVYSWRVSGPDEITPRSLAALRVVYPRPDIFLLGKGDPNVRLDIAPLTAFFRELRLAWEILPTEDALTTFNFLNSENRQVCGAFLPPTMRDMYKEEMQALEVARRRRSFQLAEPTGGTYSSEVAPPSIAELPSVPKPQRRRPRIGDPDGDDAAEAAARMAAVRAAADARRDLLDAARKRVDVGDDDGETPPKSAGSEKPTK